jgi:hypothetical protein
MLMDRQTLVATGRHDSLLLFSLFREVRSISSSACKIGASEAGTIKERKLIYVDPLYVVC